MSLGKQVRLNRLFAHSSGRLCSVAVDHFIGYAGGLPEGLRHIGPALAAIVAAQPDAVTMQKGVALAVAAFVRGPTEAVYLRALAEAVREAAHFELPVICHIYPRDFSAAPRISFQPEDIAWAVRCAVELGADVVKTPYCGDVQAHRQIVADCPVPLVAAGGPRAETLAAALEMMAEVVQSGGRGATIGRNVWGFDNVTAAVHAFKAVIHDSRPAEEALRLAGL
jgi:class I fructose-bisphosphate aldolase